MVLRSSRSSSDDKLLFMSQLSRVDWGDLKGSFTAAAAVAQGYNEEVSDKSTSKNIAPTSRYDPTTMNRIVSDLVYEEESEIESDVERSCCMRASTQRKEMDKSGVLLRRTMAILAFVAIIFGVGSIVVRARTSSNNSHDGGNPQHQSAPNYQIGNQEEQQHLLEIAERIVWACSDSRLSETNMHDCQKICHGHMCCFNDERGLYSCGNDESKECAVYAGCEALIEASTWG